MKLTEQQFRTLADYEPYFDTAVHSSWARHPGQAALREIHGIYTAATGDRRGFNGSCQSCVLHLLQDCGRLYYAEKVRREQAARGTKAKKKKPCSTI